MFNNVQERPAPEQKRKTNRPLGPGEVRLRIEAALTCGTDLKVYKRGYHARMIVPPAVFGHEMAGTLVEVSPDVHGWRVGDRAAIAVKEQLNRKEHKDRRETAPVSFLCDLCAICG